MSNVNKDLVTYYEKYCLLLSPTCTSKKLYSHCKKNFTPSQWYCDQPLGINKIKTAVKSMCKEGGIQGKFTNHSLRATCASRMFDKELPEQLIKETTGHKSDCVRVYKRTSDNLRQKACETLSASGEDNQVNKHSDDVFVKPEIPNSKDKPEKSEVGCLSYNQMHANVIKTRMEMRHKMFPKSRLKLKRSKQLIKNSSRQVVTIDVNINVKQPKSCKKFKKDHCK